MFFAILLLNYSANTSISLGKQYVFLLTLIIVARYYKFKETLAIRRKCSLVDKITKAIFSNSPNDFKIRLFG